MKQTSAKHPKQSPIKASDQTGNKKRSGKPNIPAEPRGQKFVKAGQEPISHPANKPMTFREGVYGKGKE